MIWPDRFLNPSAVLSGNKQCAWEGETYIFIAGGILAKLANRVISSLDVAARRANKIFGIALARLARRGVEAGELARSADDFPVVNGDAEESFEQIAEGGEVVHP